MTKINSTNIDSQLVSVFSTDSSQQTRQTGSQRATTKDTIETAPAAKPHFTPSKPRLLPEAHIIGASDKLYKVGERQLLLNTDELAKQHDLLEKLCRENIEKMKETARRTQDRGTWSYLQKIGSSILSAISIYLGFATLSTATLVGGALIGAGIMTLANIVLTEAGFWDWIVDKMASDNEDQRKLYRELVTIAGLTVIGGQLFALGALAVFGTFSLATIAAPIAQLAFTIASTLSSVTNQISEARVAWSQAELTELEGKLAVNQRETEQLVQRLEGTLNEQQHTFRAAKQVIELGIEARRQAIYAI